MPSVYNVHVRVHLTYCFIVILLRVHVHLCKYSSPVGPEIIEGPVNQTLNANETLQLNCTARNNTGATEMLVIVWVFTSVDGGTSVIIRENDMRVTQDDVGNDTFLSTFRIERAAPSDGGVYSCQAYNRDLVNGVSANATVTVFCEWINSCCNVIIWG